MEEPKPSFRKISPETYLGSDRGSSYTAENELKPNQVARYDYTAPLGNDKVGLKGLWDVEKERIISHSNESTLEGNFLAKQVYLVLSGSSKTAVQVYLDDQLVNEFIVDGARKYDIVTTSYGRHKLTLKIPEGISAYAFTFGDD